MNTKKITRIALLGAVAAVLMYIEMPLPFMPPFLKLDFSGVPVLLGAFAMGPLAGILIALIKDVKHSFSTQTAYVGEFADFIIMVSISLPASLIYLKSKNKKSAALGLVVGIVAMILMGALTNKFLLIPFYSKMMPIDAIIAMCNAVLPAITDINTYILFGVVPFNLIKSVILSIFTLLLYKKLSKVLHR